MREDRVSHGWDDKAEFGNGANCISATAEPAFALAITIMIRIATNMVPPFVFATKWQTRCQPMREVGCQRL
jgi:hypothetical protein